MTSHLAQLLAVFGATLAASPALAEADSFAVTPEIVAEMAPQACAAVAEELGVNHAPIPVRVVDRDQVIGILETELGPQLAKLIPDAEERAAAVVRSARAQSAQMLGKYATRNEEILIIADAFPRLAILADTPSVNTRESLQSVLVHECVHAIAHQRSDFAATFRTFDSTSAYRAYSAVIEGHAQMITRRVCTNYGCAEAFADAHASLTHLPEDLADAERYATEIANTEQRMVYVDGETFVAAVYDAGGHDAVWNLYENPPRHIEAIYDPAAYLAGTRRSERVEAWREGVAQSYGERWQLARMAISPLQFQAVFGVLPNATEIAARIRSNRVLVASNGGKQHTLVLMSFDAPQQARAHLDATLELMKVRQTMTGPGMDIQSEENRIAGAGWSGYSVVQTFTHRGRTRQVTVITATRAGQAVEATLLQGATVTDATELVNGIFAALPRS